MMNQSYIRRTFTVLAVFLTLLMSATLITALTLNSVTPSWTNAVGSSGAPDCLTTTTVGAEAQIRFGDDDFNPGCPADPNAQSGLGFEGSSGLTFTGGTPFVLGELTHYNNPIFASSLFASADLNLAVDLGDPVYTANLTSTVTLDETANNLTTCPYGDTQPCADRLTIQRQTLLFTAGAQQYQLEILGLQPGQLGSCSYNEAQISTSFISDENAANSACVFGRVIPVADAALVIEKQASVAQAEPGDIIDYQIDYNCFSTTTFCSNVVLTDYLPNEVVYLGSTGSTHTVAPTGTYASNNNTVRFQFINPLPAGSTGFVRIRVRLRDDGTVANGATISNLATSTLSNGPTSEATHSMPATATSLWDVVKTAPPVVYLDTEAPFTDNIYQVGICSSGSDINLLNAQMVDTLPTDSVFVSASDGGGYDPVTHTVTWNMGDLLASSGCTYRTVTVRYPSPPFVTAQNVVNTVDASGTIVGGIPWTDTANVTNPLQVFTPLPQVQMSKSPGRSGYIVGARADFYLAPRNTGNVALQQFTVTDTLPPQIDLTQVTVGDFTGYSGSVALRYQRSDAPGVWQTWPGSPFANNSGAQDVSALGLPGGVWVTHVQWDFGTVLPGFEAVNAGGRLRLSGTVLATDRAGTPVTVNDVITNNATLDWGFTPTGGGPGTGGSSVGSADISVDAIPVPTFDKTSAGGISQTWRFLIGQQVGYYNLTFNNNTGITLDDFTITDNVPPQFNVSSVTVGSYQNFSGTVTVRYQTTANPGVWQTWAGSPFAASNQTLNVSALGLGAGEYITNVQWQYGTVGADFRTNAAPRINGGILNPDRNGSPVNDGDGISNSASLTWTYLTTPGNVDDTQNDIVREPVANPSVQKSTLTSGPYIPTSQVTYALRVGAAGNSPSALINPIVLELLPTNLQYVPGSWAYSAGGSGVPAPTFEQIDDFNGSGRTLLRWRFTGSFPQGQFGTISFNSNILAGSPEGTLVNEYYVTSDDITIDGTITDVNDLDGDTVITDILVGTNTSIPVDELVGLDSFKGVRGELDTDYSVYPDSGFTIPNGRVDYRLTIINRGNIPINNVKVIDILPFVGDTGVQDIRPRDSEWRPFLTAPVAAPANVTVYYSTSPNPCRPQIIPSGPAGCTAPNWSTSPPADISTVQSLRFDFGSVLQPGESFNFSWTMRAPDNAPDGSIAWNSFAYTSTNAVTGVPLRPAEPNKVGIEMTRPAVTPLIDLEKYVNTEDADLPTGPYVPIGDPVTWTYVITNTGNTRLANVTLTDDQISPLVCNEGVIPNLDPADTFTCTVTGVAVADQYVNIGTVVAEPVDAGDNPLTDGSGNPLPPVTDTDPAHYFGYDATLARLGNYVWIDTNGDGDQDAGEPGLPGVTVNLYEDGNPTVVDTTTTDGSGFYLFPDLTPDDYFVEFVIPPTYSFTTQDAGGSDALDSDADPITGRTVVTTLSPMEEDLTWDAGVVAAASIGDYVWRDGNANNVQDSFEVGFAGVQVDLLDSGGAVIATTFTDAAGFYSFTDLVPGDYAVQFTPPAGFLMSLVDTGGDDTLDSDADLVTFRTPTTTLSPGENDPTWDTGLVAVASIGNYVWSDNDYDGQQDGGEPGVSGITVNLLDSGGNVINTTTTNASGFYSFTNLRPGDYAIEVILPATGYIFTTRDTGSNTSDSDADTTTGRMITTTLSPAENDLTWDAGIVPLSSIGDRVWQDLDNDGQQEAGENGFAGITVNLLDSGGTVIDTTTTDASGNYLFDQLVPGTYAIEVIRPTGYVFSPRDSGSDASDSDVNRTTGRTANTVLSPDEDDLTWDAGLVLDASIGNYVWYDTDDDGVQDGGEPVAPGVTVNLLDSGGNVISTTTTDASGLYLFDFLTPADYALEFVPPAGYAPARRDQGGDDAADSDPQRFTGRTITTTLAPDENDLTWDMGLVEVASIGDFVWVDANDNGVQDGGEVGLSGVTVRLLDAGGTVVATDTTDASGFYLFDNLPPDVYSIEVVRPANYVFSLQDQGGDDALDSDVDITTGAMIQTTLTPGEDDLTWDAGVVPAASIGNFVWRDNDNDGVQDGGEPGVNNVTVRLLDSGGTVVATTTTDASGAYSFTELRPGTYSVEFALPSGFQFSPQDAAAATDATDSDADTTTGRTIQTVLAPGENDLTWDAGLVPLARIGNFVWRDNDNDGIQDGGEPGVSGVTVNLLDSGGNQIRTTTTNGSGNYSFTNLPPGDYAVEVILPSGFQFSPQDAPAPATNTNDSDADTTTGRMATTNLAPNETDNSWDAGLVPLANIGNFVWNDTDGDGQQDAGESGVNGVTVNLLDSGGNVIGTTTTNPSGSYSFTNLPPANYAIEFVLPTGYIFTRSDSGADASDSDADRTTGRTITTTLSPGETDNTWDAGIVLPAALGDYVWLDSDDDGVQDGGESPFENVTVRLLDSGGSVIATDTTDASGNYLFDNLIPDTYSVEFVAPTGYAIARRAAAAATDATDSDADRTTGRTIQTALSEGETDLTWDAGLVALASIGDRVWIDLNNNGVQDAGENGLSGVTVELLNSGGTVISTDTTDASGNYLFDDLVPDIYAVRVVLPAGYQFSQQDAAAATDVTDSDVNTTTGRTVNTTLDSGEDDLTWDAGVVPLASIGDRVWIDINNNGVQDAGENNLAGVTVNLLNSGGTVIATDTTDASGNYLFDNLPPDVDYAVEFVLPAGYQFSVQDAAAATDTTDSDADTTTGRTINTTLTPGENDLTWDAGVVPLASLGDRVWIDINNNGVQDGGEANLAGVTVNLLNNGGTVIATDTTDASGNYLFDNLVPDRDYAVEFVLPAGYQFSVQDAAAATDTTDSDADTTTGRTINTTLTPGENDLTWDAGVVPLASIGDRVWIDINNNGVQDGGEANLAGVTVNLLNSGGTVIATDTTDASGNYLFDNLVPDRDYAVEFVLPADYQFSPRDAAAATDATDSDANTATGRTVNTTLSPNENDLTWDAGVVPLASIGDRVWDDVNDNGIQDAGENGIAGVTVNLLDSGGTVIATDTTDASGNYLFDLLPPGVYSVEFVPPTGYTIARRDQGGSDANDSDADRTTGQTIQTTLAPDEDDLTWDAGVVQFASLGDRVWIDINNNGVQDGGENGLSGVTVELLNSGGTVIATDTTDASGNYLFDNLVPDVYAVRVVLPAGYQFSAQDAAAATDATDSDVNTTTGRTVNTTLIPGENDLTWDAGVVPLASIGDRVWIDINNNGVQDAGENNLAGVTVNLLDSGGTVIATDTTDASGSYLFDLLPPDDYAVAFVLPAGYQFSAQDAAAATDATDSDADTSTGRTVVTTLDPDEDDLTWDAGVVPLASIGDRVWIDINNNGVQDGGETGLLGVTVNLLDSGGTVIATDTTDANGNYLFDNLPPDVDYAIEVILPAGYQFSPRDAAAATDATDSDVDTTTGRTINTTLTPGENDLTWDAGLVSLASIGDRVWIDINNNGVQDGGEANLPGVTVNLLDNTGTVIATDTTDASGNYLFDSLPPDRDYAVEFVLPAGYQFSARDAAAATDATDSDADTTTGRTINTTLTPGENDLTWDAGVVPLASIGDRVWIDINNNGVQDGGETGLGGVTVNLLDSSGNVIDTTVTAASGSYLFDDLVPDRDYAIEFVLPSGYQFSTRDAAAATDATDSDANISTGRTINTTLSPNENDLTWDAGVVPLASIGDTVWRDLDGDGVQDGSEPGVPGVTVNLLDAGGSVIGTTTTDANGNYLFDLLPPDVDYAIEFALPAGFIFSPRDAAAATDATDSDADTTSGRTVNTTLSPDEDDLTWDAGIAPLASIGDRVWADNNLNGVQDAGESGVAGVTVNLLDSTGTVIATTTTDANGSYLFSDLLPGDYAVEFILPAEYEFTLQDAGGDDTLDGDADPTTGRSILTTLDYDEDDLTWDAGIVALGSIGDTIWLDNNGNGVQDGGEPGIPGVVVTLVYPDGTRITDVTDGNGVYLFENLPPGVYIVIVDESTLPPGLMQTGDPDNTRDSRSVVNLGPGEDNRVQDFGYTPPASGGVTPTPTPLVTEEAPTEQAQSFSPVPACQRTCVDWQLYHTNATGDWEIFRLGNLEDRPGASPNLSQGEDFDDIAPTRSPNAEWIVFVSNRDGNWELYVAPTDGDSSKTRRITHNTVAIDTDPVWGPNNYVVFETTRDGDWELYLLDMVTGVETRLTNNPGSDINAFWSPDGSKLLFQSDRSGRWQIYELSLRTGQITRLSDGTADDVDPQYNNAGDAIAFRSYRDNAPDTPEDARNSTIYTMNANGTNPMRISDPAGDATGHAWSPDDGLIAYQSDLDGDLDVYVYAVGAGETRQLTDNDIPDYAPTWQCGTTQVIFTSEVNGNPDIYDAEALPIAAPAVKVEEAAEQLTVDPADDIYPLNNPTEEDASREGRLPSVEDPRALGEQTSFIQPEFPLTDPDQSLETGEAWQSINSCESVCPAWSLYHSDRSGDWEIFRLGEAGAAQQDLNISSGADANDFGPTRAPNGLFVAFTSDRDGDNELYIADAEGGALQRATFNPANDTDPSWSPDSQRIVFESDRDGNWNLFILDVQTGVETRITDDPADDINASWSSAGGRIAFQSNRDGAWAIYTYDLATGAVTRLTDGTANATDQVYGNGGSLIAYRAEQADGKTAIIVMDDDGTNPRVISDPAGNAQNAVWYFDDTLLAYQSDVDGDDDIYVYDFASGQTRQLTDNAVPDYAPTWQCGSQDVIFTSDAPGDADIFRTPALPLDAAPVDVTTDAEQLTTSEAADRYPMGAPTNEDASRELGSGE